MARSSSAKPPARASPPPAPGNASTKSKSKSAKPKPDDYSSEGVEDHDVFLLPISDYKIMLAITAVSALVRLFRIYQPSSVVFDEVQYVLRSNPHSPDSGIPSCSGAADGIINTASAVSLRSTSRANSSWTFILRSPSS